MTNSQYIATLLEGQLKSLGGSRKIKATRTSLDSILSAVQKMAISTIEKKDSFVDKLKEKNIVLFKIGKTDKADCTGKKAINVSNIMRDNEKNNEAIVNKDSNLTEKTFVKRENINDENKTDTTNADTIINALQIFENTNNLGTEEEKDTDVEETPVYMQVSGEIKDNQEVSNDETKEVQEDNSFEIPKMDEDSQETVASNHGNSGYLDGINAFKAQMGTDKYGDANRNFAMHTNENPVQDFTVHTNIAPMDMHKEDASLKPVDPAIDEFVKGYCNLEDLPLGEIKAYKMGCEGYVQQARESKREAGHEINSIDDQIDVKDAQINELYAQIRSLEADKEELNQNKQSWQNIYSKANTEESLGTSKIEEINKFVYQQFNSINQMDNTSGYANSYSAPTFDIAESTSHGRGRAA